MSKFLSLLFLFALFFGISHLHEGLTPFAWEDVAWTDEASSTKLGLVKITAPLIFTVEEENSYYLWRTAKARGRLRDETLRFIQLPYGKWYRY